MGNNSQNSANEGCLLAIGAFVVGLGGLIAAVAALPKEFWIVVACVVGAVAIAWAASDCWNTESPREQREKLLHGLGPAERERRSKIVGRRYAERFDGVLKAVDQISATEAARDGWLGEVDFTDDLRCIFETFEKAIDLRRVTRKLSALAEPSVEDRRIMADARLAADTLDRPAIERIDLIKKCAKEAQRIDESLRKGRESARTALERAELHGQLHGLLYGIEMAPPVAPANSAAERVISRVAASQEIKNQIGEIRRRAAG